MTQGQERRILVVDDNATNRRILQEMLENWGFGVATAGDGETALEMFREADLDGDPFHLAIIDRKMPSLDGFDLVLMDVQMPGMDGYLSKPLRQADLDAELTCVVRPEAIERVRASPSEGDGTGTPDESESSPEAPSELDGSDLAVFDQETLLTLVARDRELLSEITDIFLDSLPEHLKVVIAAADRALVHMLGAALRKRGWEVVQAFDAMQAVMDSNRTPRPDAVVLGLGMPGGTGFGVLERLARSSRTSAIPVVVITGSKDDEDVDRALGVGAAEFLRKPVEPKALVDEEQT